MAIHSPKQTNIVTVSFVYTESCCFWEIPPVTRGDVAQWETGRHQARRGLYKRRGRGYTQGN